MPPQNSASMPRPRNLTRLSVGERRARLIFHDPQTLPPSVWTRSASGAVEKRGEILSLNMGIATFIGEPPAALHCADQTDDRSAALRSHLHTPCQQISFS